MATLADTRSSRKLVQADDARHLLRRLIFATTPESEKAIAGKRVDEAFDSLILAAKSAPAPAAPEFVREVWTNDALRLPGMTSQEYQTKRDTQSASNQRDIERLRGWWLREMIAGPAALRENLVLFFQGTIGSSSGSADMPQAVHACNALLRKSVLGTIPDLLEQLIVDPATMIQIGIDEPFRDKGKLSDHPGRLVLQNWTVGAGEYSDRDAMELTRALTGWLLVAPPGHQPTVAIDPEAFRSARRTGLVPTFERSRFEDGPKTILGRTENFDARSAIRFLAQHPATARRFSTRVIRYFGVDDTNRQLENHLVETYRATNGSVEALLREIVLSDRFWAAESRWALIKSPAQLVVGACRQLGITEPPMAEVSRWLVATGQKLFDTPNFGDGGWSGQERWVTPSDRLAVRYQLGSVLSGRLPQLGVASASSTPTGGSSTRLAVGTSLQRAPASTLLARLDPAPGVDLRSIERRVSGTSAEARVGETVREIVSTRQYQMA